MKPDLATKTSEGKSRAPSKSRRPNDGKDRINRKKVSDPDPDPTNASSTASRRTERKRTERIQRILDAAAQVFAERGYRDANLELIAARLDMRGPSIYHYFQTKEELYVQCVASLSAEIFKQLEVIAGGDAPAIDRLRALFRHQVLSQLRDYYPQYIPLTITIQLTESGLQERLRETRAYHIGLFRRVASEAAKSGDLPQDQWKLGLRLAFGALGFLHRWYQPGGAKTAEQLADEIADALMRLLGAGVAVSQRRVRRAPS